MAGGRLSDHHVSTRKHTQIANAVGGQFEFLRRHLGVIDISNPIQNEQKRRDLRRSCWALFSLVRITDCREWHRFSVVIQLSDIGP
jgi:hypothetical protein